MKLGLPKYFRKSIKRRFILYAVLLTITGATVLGSLLTRYESKVYTEFIEERAITIVRNLAGMSIPLFYSYNLGALQQLSDDATDERDVLYVVFYTKENMIAGATGASSLQRTIPADSIISKMMSSNEIQIERLVETDFPGNYTNVLEIVYPVIPRGESTRWGTLRLGIGLSEVERQIARVNRYSVLLTLAILMIGTLISIILGNRISRPMENLLNATRSVATGSLDFHIDIEREDDIGELGRSFNNMIDELRSSKRKIEEFTDELEKKVEERTRELRESEKKLDRARRLESLGILAGGVAHDLNNTLVPMLAIPQLILSKRPDDPELAELVNLIKKATERAADTVNDLLTLARRGKYKMKPLDLNNLLRSFFESTAFSAIQNEYSKVVLESDLAKERLNIECSESHVHQVVLNLVNNAYEAMEHGGILRIRTSFMRLEDKLSGYEEINEGDYVLLEIEDSGSGINDEDLQRIFEPFYTDKELGRSGSGLGLAVVWGVLKDHDAYIDVETELGAGTKFSIYFPQSTKSEETVEEEFDKPGGSEKILVVDDREEQREIAQEILSSLGYEVSSVEDGHLAVEFVRKNDVDLVILDMIMEEGFDGLDTYREIIKFKGDQKAIIISGYAETERVKEAQKLGAGKYLRKPYTIEKIAKTVREELDREQPNIS